MAHAYAKSLGSADERRPFAGHGYVDIVNLGERSVGCATFEPGWRWSQDLKPIVKTESCMAEHALYMLSGQMHVEMSDGQVLELSAGDLAAIPPGHDAWVVGDQTCRLLDFEVGPSQYAKPAGGKTVQPEAPELGGTPASM